MEMDPAPTFVNFYTVLAVEPDAGESEITAAYRRLALIHHPDKNPYSYSEAEKHMKVLNEAYDTLRDAHTRATFHKKLAAVNPWAAMTKEEQKEALIKRDEDNKALCDRSMRVQMERGKTMDARIAELQCMLEEHVAASASYEEPLPAGIRKPSNHFMEQLASVGRARMDLKGADIGLQLEIQQARKAEIRVHFYRAKHSSVVSSSSIATRKGDQTGLAQQQELLQQVELRLTEVLDEQFRVGARIEERVKGAREIQLAKAQLGKRVVALVEEEQLARIKSATLKRKRGRDEENEEAPVMKKVREHESAQESEQEVGMVEMPVIVEEKKVIEEEVVVVKEVRGEKRKRGDEDAGEQEVETKKVCVEEAIEVVDDTVVQAELDALFEEEEDDEIVELGGIVEENPLMESAATTNTTDTPPAVPAPVGPMGSTSVPVTSAPAPLPVPAAPVPSASPSSGSSAPATSLSSVSGPASATSVAASPFASVSLASVPAAYAADSVSTVTSPSADADPVPAVAPASVRRPRVAGGMAMIDTSIPPSVPAPSAVASSKPALFTLIAFKEEKELIYAPGFFDNRPYYRMLEKAREAQEKAKKARKSRPAAPQQYQSIAKRAREAMAMLVARQAEEKATREAQKAKEKEAAAAQEAKKPKKKPPARKATEPKKAKVVVADEEEEEEDEEPPHQGFRRSSRLAARR